MIKLIQGIEQFQANVFGPQRRLFERLAQGQSPPTLFITCCDSRVQPDIVTGSGPGELFVLRNIGNVVPPHGGGQTEAEAAIEYAAVQLKVRDIVVCGHSHCGAMQAMLDPSHLGALPAVADWLKYADETRDRVRRKYPNLKGEELLDAAIRENVLVQVERVESLPSITPRLRDGRLKVHGWVYRFEAGEIIHFRKELDAFVPITQAEVTRELSS